MMKAAALFSVAAVLLLLFSASVSALEGGAEKVSDASCEDVGTFDVFGKLVCKVKSSVSSIGGWFEGIIADAINWVINPPISSTGVSELHSVFQWLAFTGIGILVVDTGVRYLQASMNPEAVEEAKKQARNIVVMVIAVIASPLIVTWALDLVRLISELILLATVDPASLAVVLVGGLVAAFVASSPIFPISWTAIIIMLLSFIFVMLLRIFVLTAFTSMLPLILFLYFWERTSQVGRRMLNILAANIFIPILWITVFAVAAKMPGGYKLLSPLLVLIAFPLNAYLYFTFGGVSANFIVPPSPIRAAGAALASTGSRIRQAVVARRTAVDVERKALTPYVRGESVQAEKGKGRARSPAEGRLVPTTVVTRYHFNASDLNFGQKNVSPHGRRFQRIYESGKSNKFLNYAANSDKDYDRVVQHTELGHNPHMTLAERRCNLKHARVLFEKIPKYKHDEILDSFDNYEKVEKAKAMSGGVVHGKSYQRVKR